MKQRYFRLTGEEHDWLSRLIKKRAKMARAPEHKSRAPKLTKLIIGLEKKLVGDQEPLLNKHEIHALTVLVQNHYDFAVGQVAPELMSRINKNTERRPRYEKDLKNLQRKQEMLLGLLNRLRGES